MQTKLVRPLRNGQITLPADFRRILGLDLAPLLQITLQNDALVIRAYDPQRLPAGSAWLRDLYRLYGPVRHGAPRTDEQDVDEVIDHVMSSVRGGRHAPGGS